MVSYLFICISCFAQQENTKDLPPFLHDTACKKTDKLNSLKQRLSSYNIDTNNLIYITVFNTYFATKYISEDHISINISEDSSLKIISEILIIRKKDKKIIGSHYLCNDGKGFIHFVIPIYRNLSTLPCRQEERLIWIPESYYSKIKYLLKKKKDSSPFVIFYNLGSLFAVFENGKTEIIDR